jgi:hypothetical protein
MVVEWAPWWTGQTERTTFLTVGATGVSHREPLIIDDADYDLLG